MDVVKNDILSAGRW